MRKVAEMSKDIINEYRERQKTRLQRTFVGAAEAAHFKIKGTLIFFKFMKCILFKDNGYFKFRYHTTDIKK